MYSKRVACVKYPECKTMRVCDFWQTFVKLVAVTFLSGVGRYRYNKVNVNG